MHQFYDFLGHFVFLLIGFLAVYTAGLGFLALFCEARDLFFEGRHSETEEHSDNTLQSRSTSVKERK